MLGCFNLARSASHQHDSVSHLTLGELPNSPISFHLGHFWKLGVRIVQYLHRLLARFLGIFRTEPRQIARMCEAVCLLNDGVDRFSGFTRQRFGAFDKPIQSIARSNYERIGCLQIEARVASAELPPKSSR